MHVSPLAQLHVGEFTLKRALAYLSWQRKRKYRFSSAVLRTLIADMHAQKPDHVLVTGDQCNLSLGAEFTLAAHWLEQLGSPAAVSVIPGNHDAHLRRPSRRWQSHWGSYMRGDDGRNDFPYLRMRGPVAIIGVSSAIPTALMMANGRVGRDQLARLRRLLQQTRQSGLFRVVLIHHPPQIGAMKWRKALSDAAAFRAVLKDEGAELVLHGHGHEAVRASIEGPMGPIAVRGCASASGNGHRMPPAHYHAITIAPEGAVWAVDITHRQYDHATQRFTTSDTERWTTARPAQGFDMPAPKL